MKYYFVRANGSSCHNDPKNISCYIAGEPGGNSFDYFQYCLNNNIARIGWPAVGSLSKKNDKNAIPSCYSFDTLEGHVKEYLNDFQAIARNDIIIMPTKKGSSAVHIGQVNRCYHYEYDIPDKPYECAHRIGVYWDKNSSGTPVIYSLSSLGINNQGGWWIKAFSKIESDNTIKIINSLRANK